MMATTTACQKEAFPLAGLLSQLGTGNAWNLSKPDMHSRIAGGAILTIPKVNRAAEKVIFLTFADGVEGFSDITTLERKDVSESIKKGSISNATLWNCEPPDRDLCRMQKSILKKNQQLEVPQDNHPGMIGGITYKIFVGQPFGSMPKRSSSLRPSVLSQLAKLIPASEAATSNCAFNSGVMRTGKTGALPSDECFLSRFAIDMYIPTGLVFHLVGIYPNTVATEKETPPNGITSTERGLTTSDRFSIEAAMKNHTTPLAGRDSLTPNKFTWRFLAISRIDRSAKPCRMSVEASTEREARQLLAPHFILSLSARLPILGVGHA